MVMQPYIGWDLELHPPALKQAYWRDAADKTLQSDRQVASYFMLAVAVMTVPQMSAVNGISPAVALVAAWLLALSWVLLLQLPKLYTRNRLVILTVLRLLMAWAASKSNNCCLQAQLHNPLQAQEASAAFTMFVQLLLVTNTVHIPMLAVRLPMPILLQLLLLSAQPVLLVWGGMTQDLAGCTNSTDSQSTLRRLIAGWGTLIESGTFVPMKDSAALQGRSSAMLVALCTMYTTTVGITLYVCYMCLWADVVRWLRLQARSAGEEPGQDAQSELVTIHGCRMRREQLQGMWTTPAVMLLFNSTGPKGQLSRVCIHICFEHLVSGMLAAQSSARTEGAAASVVGASIGLLLPFAAGHVDLR